MLEYYALPLLMVFVMLNFVLAIIGSRFSDAKENDDFNDSKWQLWLDIQSEFEYMWYVNALANVFPARGCHW